MRNISLSLFGFFLFSYLLTSAGDFDVQDSWVRYEVARHVVTGVPLDLNQFQRTWDQTPEARSLKIQFPTHRWGQVYAMMPFVYLGGLLKSLDPQAEYVLPTFLNAFWGALVILVFFYFLNMVWPHPKENLIMTFLFGFSTMIFVYTHSMHDAIQETFFALSAVYFSWKLILAQRIHYFLGVIFCVIGGLLTRYTFILLFPALMYLWMIHVRSLLKQNPRKVSLVGWEGLILLGLGIFMVWVGVGLGASLQTISSFSRDTFVNLNFHSFLNALFGLLFSPAKSFFIFNPVFIVGVFGIFGLFKYHRHLAIVVGLVTICYVFFYAFFRCFTGDPAWGPRYLLVLIPFWMFPVAVLFQHRKKIITRSLYGLSIIGFCFQWVGILICVTHYIHVTNLVDELPRYYYERPDVVYYLKQWKYNAIFRMGRELPDMWNRMRTYHYRPISEESLKKLHQRRIDFIEPDALKEALAKGFTDNVFDLWWIKAVYFPPAHFRWRIILMMVFLLGWFGSGYLLMVGFISDSQMKRC
ncbi:MAG: hypothetical protein HY390_03320 [Deltaproteobacteria bacterium]|nr:hypothetical protein [Deltaproteobacteria bacterium]